MAKVACRVSSFFLLCGIIWLTSCSGDGANTTESVIANNTLIPFQDMETSMWGFLDMNGNVAIKPDFESAPSIHKDGYAVFQDNGIYQYIDESGKLAGKKYLKASLFHEGLACVVEKDKPLAFINKNLETAFTLPATIENAGIFSGGLCRVEDNQKKCGFIDATGKIVIRPRYDFVSSFNSGRAVVAVFTSKKNYGRLHSGGLSQIYEERESGGDDGMLWGVIDTKGNEIIKPTDKYIWIRRFSNGMATFISKDKKSGCIDVEGKEIFAGRDYSRIGYYKDGFVSFERGGKWGLLNNKGEEIIRTKYNVPLQFFNGLALTQIGFINQKEEVIIKPAFVDVSMPFVGKCAAVTAVVGLSGGAMMIDREGKPVSENLYQEIGPGILFNLYDHGEIFNPNEIYQNDAEVTVCDCFEIEKTYSGTRVSMKTNSVRYMKCSEKFGYSYDTPRIKAELSKCK